MSRTNTDRDESRGLILLVDDKVANLQLLSAILAAEGYTVRPAINAEIALTAIVDAVPDLIITDVLMPGLNGYELAAKVKADPRSASVPIMFISALSKESQRGAVAAAGGVGYIAKPLDADDVLRQVRLHIRRD